MAGGRENVLLDNDVVKVVRVRVDPGAKHSAPPRGPRVVISLSNESEVRTEGAAKPEAINRKIGDVVFRSASSGHTIENRSKSPHDVIIVELKPR